MPVGLSYATSDTLIVIAPADSSDLIYLLSSRLDRTINVFHIKPPLVIGMRLARLEQVRGSNGDAPSQARVHDRLAHQIVRPGRRVRPRAALDAAVAHRAFFVRKVKAGATLHVQLPGLVAVVHHLVARRDSFARAILRADFAVLAKVLQAKVNRFVWILRPRKEPKKSWEK